MAFPCLCVQLAQQSFRRNQPLVTLSSSKPKFGEFDEEKVGDASVQDALVNIIRLETTKRVVSDLAEESKNRLIEEAKEIQANFETEYRINMNETLRALEEAGNKVGSVQFTGTLMRFKFFMVWNDSSFFVSRVYLPSRSWRKLI